MLHMVTKSFNAGSGKDLRIGDVVETGGWKNERLLLEHRYIARTDAPHPTVIMDAPTPVKRGRGRPRKTSLLASPIQGSRSITQKKRSTKKVSKKES